jgi:hypothetical protein
VQIGSPILPNVEGTEQIWMTRWRVNAVNNGAIPTRGWLVDTQVNWQYDSPDTFAGGQNLGSTDPFGQAWSRILYAKPLTDKWTAVFRVLGGGTFAGPAAPFSDFRLGGPFRLGALETGELRGDYVAYASIAGLRKIHEAPASFIGNIYAMAMYETGDAFRSRMNLFHTGTAGVMAETNLGVLGAGYSYGEQGRHGFFFSLGRVFDVGGRGSNVLR